MSQVIAITVGDIHISNCPSARSAEPDWFEAMRRQFSELAQLALKHNVPIIAAGDIVHRWNISPELINFAIDELPQIFAIPGQHDLPDHRLDQIGKSAYWTLVEAQTIVHISKPTEIGDDLWVHPFPWGSEIVPLHENFRKKATWKKHLAVVHSYIWQSGYSYPGADEDKRVSKYLEKLEGYDAAVFGDNHKGFYSPSVLSPVGKYPSILNGGTFFRRNSDEKKYQPHVGLLMDDGTFGLYYLDVSEDKFIEEIVNEGVSERTLEIIDAVTSLREIGRGQTVEDFIVAVNNTLNHLNVDDVVRKLVLDCVVPRA